MPTPKIKTTIELKPELYNACKSNGLKLNKCLEMGINLILAENYLCDYDPSLRIVNKLKRATTRLEELNQELEQDGQETDNKIETEY